jgi:hypothetical protein
MSYLDVQAFGDALITTQDLDPVYCAIYHARLPEPQLCRLLLAYWCFYHLGVAASISEKEHGDFWEWMRVAAVNEQPPKKWNLPGDRWPRSSERRHFRGEKCVKAVERLRVRFAQPEGAVRSLAPLTRETAIINRVLDWPMCGPWIAFKAADMMERVYGSNVEFNQNIGLMYDSPRAGLDLIAAAADTKSPKIIYHDLLTYFSSHRAPPRNDRHCGPQEVETILCKYFSMHSGHYRVGKDIHEVRQALTGWGKTAEHMLDVMPMEVAFA